MGQWQEIWREEGARRLWRVPDQQIAGLVREWKAEGTIRRVLDLGCGVGRHALLLARNGFEVYASDHSEKGVQICRQWLQAEGLPGKVWHGEMDEIPYPDYFFDAVIAFNSIYHGTAGDVEAVLKLLHAKLRPDGICFATLLSCQNRMYGKGEAVEPHTFISRGMFHQLFARGGERGVPHHFSFEEEVRTFFKKFVVRSLTHEELSLPSARQGTGEPTWFRIPGAYFWRVLASRDDGP